MIAAAPAVGPAAPSSPRVAAIDWLRGVVMVLMTIDHASGTFNAGRLMNDGAFLYTPGTPLPAAQFFTRWITHLCAPTFVFLAGAALALSVEKRRIAGEAPAAIDRFIATRGLLIAALDPLWMSWVFAPGRVLLQVLYAIGGSLVLMVPLRRLPDGWLVAAALVFLVGGEAITGVALAAAGGTPTVPIALLLTGGQFGRLIVAYPLLPWLAMMLLGWSFGRFLERSSGSDVARRLAMAGAAGLGLFLLVRGLNGYGNMHLWREDGSLVQWLHVSKYPPSLSYASLELSLMAFVLALQLGRDPRQRHAVSLPLVVLGQTALFFYVLHVHLLTLAARALGGPHQWGLVATYAAAFGALGALYPACTWYRRYKRARPDGWARYL